MKVRVGIAAALLAAGGAIGLVALTTNSGGAAPTAAAQAAYTARYWHHQNLGSQLDTAINDWGWSQRTSIAALTGMTQQGFNQTTWHGRQFAEQRGIVVLATNRFLILQSANGRLHLWLLSGQTVFQNVSATITGTTAMTGNGWAAQQAMGTGNMTPATNTMVGSTQVAGMMQAPVPQTQTVTVQVAGTDLTVTVTITRNTATVGQTATMPQNAMPTWHRMWWRQNPWTMAGNGLARGDLALVIGFRSHGLLHARLILFTPLTTGPGTGGTPTPTPTATATTPVTPTPTASASSTAGVTGTHF